MPQSPGGQPVRQDPIRIVDHDPRWAEDFDRERRRVEPVLAPWLVLPIEHIGSTAVPGLPAKPVIDMLAVVGDWAAFGDALVAVRALGWVHAPEPGDDERRKWSLCYPRVAHRTHHLHVVERTCPCWPRWLAFRDHLRADSGVAAEYGRLKRRLAERDAGDRAGYRPATEPFIRGVLGGQ